MTTGVLVPRMVLCCECNTPMYIHVNDRTCVCKSAGCACANVLFQLPVTEVELLPVVTE